MDYLKEFNLIKDKLNKEIDLLQKELNSLEEERKKLIYKINESNQSIPPCFFKNSYYPE